MTRTEFLQQLWNRIFRPIILLAVIWFCVQFLISIFTEKGTARGLTIFVLLLTILFALVHLAGIFLGKTTAWIDSKLSDRTKAGLKVLSTIINFISLPLLGILLYKCWEKDAVMFSIIVLIFLGDRITTALKTKF